MPQAHSADFFWHMWKPEPCFHCLVAQLDEVTHVGRPNLGLHLIAMAVWLHGWLNDIVNKVAHSVANLFVFWRKREINHFGVSPPTQLRPFCCSVTKVCESKNQSPRGLPIAFHL